MQTGLRFNLEVREVESRRIDVDRFLDIYKKEWEEFKEDDLNLEEDRYAIEEFILEILDTYGVDIMGVDGTDWSETDYELIVY